MLGPFWSAYSGSPKWLKTLIRKNAWILRAVLKPFVSSVRIGGFVMHLDLGDNASLRYLGWAEESDDRLRAIFLRLIAGSPDCTVIDVGASYGLFALSAAALAKAGAIRAIVAVEPDARCIGALARSMSANGFTGYMRSVHGIAGDRNGEANLYVSANASTSNRSFDSRDDGALFSLQEVRTVPAVRLDDEVSRERQSEPFRVVIKIDVEGSEARVLRGLSQTLTDAASCGLIFEYYPTGMRAVQQSREELFNALSGHRWTECWVEDHSELRPFASQELLWSYLHDYYDRFVGTSAAPDVILLRGLSLTS